MNAQIAKIRQLEAEIEILKRKIQEKDLLFQLTKKYLNEKEAENLELEKLLEDNEEKIGWRI